MNLNCIIYFIILLCISLIPIRKIWNKRDLNLFDIIILTYSIYFIYIPLKFLLFKTPINGIPYINTINNHPLTLIYLIAFFSIVAILSLIFNKKKFTNITALIIKLDSETKISFPILVIALICFLYCTIILTSYGNLDEDNTESNRNILTYGGGFFGYLIQLSYTLTFIGLVWVVKYIKDNRKNIDYKIIALLILGIVNFLLGGRGDMIFALFLIFLYLYSVYRKYLRRKHYIIILFIIGFFGGIILPISQSFRQVKDYMIMNNNNHSFKDVLIYYISIDKKEFNSIYNSAQDNTSFRSISTYYFLDRAIYKEDLLSMNGEYTKNAILKCINPLYTPSQEIYNKPANLIANGGDIAESPLMIFWIDTKWFSLIIVLLFYFGYILLINLQKIFINSFFKIWGIEYLNLYFILDLLFSIEMVPNYRKIWNNILPIYIFYCITLYLVNKIKKLE